ncbi:MAG: serine/threonine-protein kinase [Blastocatellia bacterium]|nr:serine/threonine-protein kinase [Blastocatellia bacterium]
MTPERWQQVDQLLEQTLERPEEERAGFLAAASGDDEELRREVESLLGFHQRAEGFIETPPAEMAANWLASKSSREGATIGPYEIVRLIGRGGMGEVYLARDARLERQVALKLLPPQFIKDGPRLQRFRQEARAASALNHPNIITIHEIGEAETGEGRVHFIATEFIEGHTLRDLIRDGALGLGESIETAIQIADALAAAHAAGITHRDIKPENIMLRPDGYVKVLDFGLAKLKERQATGVANNDEFATEPGIVLGTVNYMSPEQARGGEIDGRTDLFSLGVVLHEMLTSHRPFGEETLAEAIGSLLTPVTPPELARELPIELRNAVNRLLARNPAERFQTADELRRELRRLQRRLAGPEKSATRELTGRSLLAQRMELSRIASDDDRRVNTAEAPARKTAAYGRPPTSAAPAQRRAALLLIALAALSIGVMLVLWWRRAPRAPRIESIAVLPFQPLVADQRDEVLEMGLAEAVITRLSNRLTVRPLNAVRRFSGLEQDAQFAGRELGVQAVLEGNLQRADGKIRLTVRLIETASGRILWAGQFDERWTDLFAVQDAFTQRIIDDVGRVF